MNSPAALLTLASQQALAEAALVWEHAQGFVYVPVLVQSERAGALAMEVLRPVLKARLFRVPWPLPQLHTDDPDEAQRRMQADLQAVRQALDDATHRLPAGAVLLLDMSSSTRQVVARPLLVLLNQRREDWRRNGQGLLLLWPQSESEALMQGAPDLWSMRAVSPWVEEQATAAHSLPSVPWEPRPLTPGSGIALSPAQQRQYQSLLGASRWQDADMSAADVLALVVALRKVHQASAALALVERMLHTPDFGSQTLDWRASMFMELALLRREIGDRQGALAPATEAVNIRRRLAQANPAAYEPVLAGSLNNLANRLSQIGDHAGALAPATEAVNIRRRLAQTNPAAYEPDLAMSLNNLAIRLSQTGDRAGALAPATKAVDIYRRLAQANPAAYEPDLAMSLNNLANRLSETGDRAGALAPVTEAVNIHRRLAQANPAAYEPDLAMSLNNLAGSLSETGDRAGALAPATEAVNIRRRLAQANPAAYEPDLAGSLWTAMLCFAAAQQYQTALIHGREALQLFTRLAEREPARFQPSVQELQAELQKLEPS